MGMIRAVALWEAELGWMEQRDWEEEFEKLQYQALKKCVNAMHGSRRELVSQIAEVESPRMALDTVQARVMGKLMRDPSYIDDLWKADGSRRCLEEGRTLDDFDDAYLGNDKYTSVLTVIMGKAGKVREEGNERIS